MSELSTPAWRRSTEDHREEAFRRYCESKRSYNDAIEAAGDTPWHEGDNARRRELFFRRFAPVSIPSNGIA